MSSTFKSNSTRLSFSVVVIVSALGWVGSAVARPPYRSNFFDAYPSAVGTVLDNVPSHSTHCGVCHYDFDGGGALNPYGLAVQATDHSVAAILSLGGGDHDGDGFSNDVEITDTVNYINTPTFPGLTPANVGSAFNVNLADIQDYLVPSQGGDVTPPVVTVIAPNGGQMLVANASTTVQWTATDVDSGVAVVNLYVSLDGGATYAPVALALTNSGSYTWFPANRPTTQALFLVEAIDNAFNPGEDTSDSVFTVASPAGGIVPTTLRDFDMPGTQPFEAAVLNPPSSCTPCHGGYDPSAEPAFNWSGSMMAQAARDPLFEAALAIANQDAPDSGDLCLRCHISRGWLQGRSVPTSGKQMLASDKSGVSCDLCHRLVDPIQDVANPAQDTGILADLSFGPPDTFGTGMYVVDPTGARRGPFVDADSGHTVLVSPFHREAALCGTCHNVSNPAFEKDANGVYVPNALDAPASSFHANVIGPVERTYSEWLNSHYNTPQGVYAPQFGGNLDYVASCQDCHMRDVTGQGCILDPPVRDDLPLHDMTGGSAWLPTLLPILHPGDPLVDPVALAAGAARARYMLQNAADVRVGQQGRTLSVTVVNNTGHKLPTGYPEGRRAWLNVKFFDQTLTLVGESGAYDPNTAVLSHDAEAKVYEIHPVTAGIPGLPDGTEFHFVLNNSVAKDNRIPPRGFTNAAFADFGGAPAGYSYADGQYWDQTAYGIPSEATSAEVTLYYQSTSKEFIEFLRDENFTDTSGQKMYDLWNNYGKCPPELMAQFQLALSPPVPGDMTGDDYVDVTDFMMFRDCMTGPNAPYAQGCAPADLDFEGDVDMRDFALFQIGFTGPDTDPPTAPVALAATGGRGFIGLDWDDGGADVAGYRVYRSTIPGGPYDPVSVTLIPISEFSDTTVLPGATYSYVVTAVDPSDNESAPSVEASATTLGGAFAHVESIDLAIDDQGGGNKFAVATVTILDEFGLPAAGADVTGTFSGRFTGNFTESTDANGVAVFIDGPRNGNTDYGYCVDTVVHGTLTYDMASNIETCDTYP
ncbi:MAG: hypothetical protein KDA32_10200 [Phycisphaerales bacterium]|nr:hypothetical protein [Phycisphaerales bacterium]